MPQCPRRQKKSDIGKRDDWRSARKSKDRPLMLGNHLFITEGTKTEPHYLYGLIDELVQQLGSDVKKHLIVEPQGTNTLFLLDQAEQLLQNTSDLYQHVWILYDLDDFPLDRFDNTVHRCEALSKRNRKLGYGPEFHAIWSNQCFELWLLLHFCPLDADISRKAYSQKLSEQLKARGLCEEYEKRDPALFSYLRPYLSNALRNAKLRADACKGLSPSQSAPCTAVPLLFSSRAFGAYIK